MLLSRLQSVSPAFLEIALYHVFQQEVPDFFSLAYFVQNLDFLSQVFVFEDFFLGFDSDSVEVFVVVFEYFHQALQRSSVETQCSFISHY